MLFRSCVVTSDAYEALFGCNHLEGIYGCQVALCVPFPFSLRAMLGLPWHVQPRQDPTCWLPRDSLTLFFPIPSGRKRETGNSNASLHACLHVHA